MDDIIETLECLRDVIGERDAKKGFDIVTALLLQIMDAFGHSSVMVKLFPLLEQLKNTVQHEKFDDALAMVLALLARFRQAKEQYSDSGNGDGGDTLHSQVPPRPSGRPGGRMSNDIDLDFRPASYFGPKRLEDYLLSQVKGAAIRRKLRALF
jgi:hypothetical protein